jgi:phosphoglycolate phosphatase
MAVLSNKPDRSAKSIVTRLLSRWTFEQVIGAGPSLPLKPNPAVALRIASLMRIPPERYIYVGDTEIDMQTARAARMRPAGVLWGFRTEEELRASGAELLLAKPADLLMYLG